MKELSNRINSLPISATLEMAAKARELKNQGINVIGLSLGEPDFNTPEFIKKAAIQAVEDNYNSYTPVDGYAELKEAICEKFQRDNNITYTPNQVVVSTGAKQSIANVCMVLSILATRYYPSTLLGELSAIVTQPRPNRF